MIRPDQIQAPNAKSAQYDDHMKLLEKEFDAAILRAEKDSRWPARVGTSRMTFDEQAVVDTIQRYRDAGWVVKRPLQRGVLATIDRPVT